jgi:hypothetical protein
MKIDLNLQYYLFPQSIISSLKPFGALTEDRAWDKDVFMGFKSVKMNIVSRT